MEKMSIPKPGEIYQHFKDKPYQIIAVATHSETGEKMVVYQALYGEFKTFVRPLDMFISEVDHVKYPEVTQKYRFELRRSQEQDVLSKCQQNSKLNELDYAIPQVQLNAIEQQTTIQPAQNQEQPQQITANTTVPETNQPVVNEEAVNAILIRFLDATSYSKKMEVLSSNIKHLDDRLINDMAVSLDCAIDDGPLDQRIQGLIYCLQAMCRFEDRRLR